ncbi:MAG: TonB-dependent receptor plug domain-containing protein [Polyangiaceae bacterium]
MRHRARFVGGLLGLGALVGSGAVRAEELSDLEGLLEEKVVTSASQSSQTARAAPATSITITAEQLQRYGIRTIDEAIRFLAVGATTNETARQPDFGARGVLIHSDRNNHVLILVDGHTTNEQVSGSGQLDRAIGVPIELVDHVEVILGPGSVLYGSSAMLAVINVVTKRAEDHDGFFVGAESEPFSFYRGTVGVGRKLKLFGDEASFTLQLEGYRFHDPIDLPRVNAGLDAVNGQPILWGGTWEHNEYTGGSAYGKLDIGRFRFTLRSGMVDRNNPLVITDFDNPDQGDRDRWLSLDASYRHTVSSRVELGARLYGDSSDEQLDQRSSFPQYCLPGQTTGCDTAIKGRAISAGTELQARFDWLGDGSLKTLVGADMRARQVGFSVDTVDHDSQFNSGTLAYYDELEQTLGVYAQHEVELGEAWSVNGGARFDTAPNFDPAVSPRFAVAFASWPGATLKAVYSRAFRAPNASERAFEHPLYAIRAGDLEAETVTSIEASYEQRFGTQRLLLNVFRSQWENFVRLSRLSAAEEAAAKADGRLLPFAPQAFQYRNDAEIDGYGLVAAFDGSVVAGALRYGASATISHTRQLTSASSDGNALPASPEIFGNANVSYAFGDKLPTLGLAGHYVASSPVFGVAEESYPERPKGPARLVGRLTLSGAMPGVSGLSYRAYVQSAVGDEAPISVSPVNSRTAANPDPVVLPLETFRTGVGLDYNLPW